VTDARLSRLRCPLASSTKCLLLQHVTNWWTGTESKAIKESFLLYYLVEPSILAQIVSYTLKIPSTYGLITVRSHTNPRLRLESRTLPILLYTHDGLEYVEKNQEATNQATVQKRSYKEPDTRHSGTK